MSTGARAAGRAALISAAIAGVVAVGASRARSEARAELLASDASRAKGDWTAATVHARRAASALPGTEASEVALRRLAELASAAEARSDPGGALFAWNALRSATFAARWTLAPREAERAQADAAIARLAAAAPGGTRERRPEETERQVAGLLAREDVPGPLFRALLVAGAASWMAGVAWALARGVTPEGRPVRPVLRRAAWVAAAGVACTAVALLRG